MDVKKNSTCEILKNKYGMIVSLDKAVNQEMHLCK